MAKAIAAIILAWCLTLPAWAAGAPAKPVWQELTAQQQQILAPLKEDWDRLDSPHRKKWVQISDRYPTMKPEEQQRLTQRMQTWARLTPEQRHVARQKHQAIKQLPPEKRAKLNTQWQEYQKSKNATPDSKPLVVTPPTSMPAAAH
jgi:hypothetical protein